MKKTLTMLAAAASLSGIVSTTSAAEITILRDDFDSSFLPATDWIINFSAGANVRVDTANSSLVPLQPLILG
jgi:hypothetical protein